MVQLTTTAALFSLLGCAAVAAPTAKAAEFCDEATGLCYSESTTAIDVTYRIAVPEGAEGEYDVALQMVAPIATGWAAIAWGGQMAGNPITLAWANGDEVVVSSRMASGHSMPAVYDGATYTTLPGSSVNATHWTASVLCSGCTSWSGGSVDPTNTAARFAFGMSSMGPNDPSDPGSMFGIHQMKGGWEHDMAAGANADFNAIVEAALAGGEEEEEPMGGM